MSRKRNTLAEILANPYEPPAQNQSSLFSSMGNAFYKPPPETYLDWWSSLRPKTEWVSGYYRRVPIGFFQYTLEWVPGYWRGRN